MRRRRIRPKPFRIDNLYRNGNKGLGRMAFPTHLGPGLTPLSDGNVGLVDLDFASQLLASGAHHRPTQPVQHGPGGLVAAQPQHTLQSQGTDALLLVGHVPRRAQPDLQRGARLIEDRAGGDAALMSTTSADESCATSSAGLRHSTAVRTDKPRGPAQSLQVRKAGLLCGEPVQKLAPGSRVVFTRNGL